MDVRYLTKQSLEEKKAPEITIVLKKQNLKSNTTCTSRHDKENLLL